MEVHVVVTYGGILGRLARWFGLTWNHAALRYVRDAPAGARVIEADACGVRERAWEDFIAGAEEHQAFRVKGGLPGVTMREIVAYAWGNVGKPYNYWWLVRIAWELVKRRFVAGILTYPAHVCSSLVYDCFRYAGVDLLPGQEGMLVTPDDLADSPLLEEVEVG
jgi:uncharacterized protein YycO